MTRLSRVAYLTAGAAGMYCGSCMNDNSLARAMQKQGIDCVLLPVYTPIRVDREDVSQGRVFLGGVNIYLDQQLPLYRSLPRWMTGWLDSPWLLRKVTRWAVGIEAAALGALTESMLAGEAGNQRRETIALADWLEQEVKPQVIVLTNLLIGGCIPELRKRSGAPIAVMLQGDDLFIEHLPPAHRERCLRRLRELVQLVDVFFCNADFYAFKMASLLGIPAEKISKIPLGLELAEQAPPMRPDDAAAPPRIGYLARLAPEKGLHVLVDAFIQLHARNMLPGAELHVAGWLGPQHRQYAEQQWAKLKLNGLSNQFTYHGSPDFAEKSRLLRSFDVLSVPTTYDEPKGLFVLEAFAAGVPVVQPNRGAFPEIIADCGGGILVPADDTVALAEAIANLLRDRDAARQLGEMGFQGLQRTRSIEVISTKLIESLAGLLTE